MLWLYRQKKLYSGFEEAPADVRTGNAPQNSATKQKHAAEGTPSRLQRAAEGEDQEDDDEEEEAAVEQETFCAFKTEADCSVKVLAGMMRRPDNML